MLDPEDAANSAAVATFVCINRPGMRLSQGAMASYICMAMPLRMRISPKSTKSGTEIST
jgi:hypothetical protein